MIRRCILSDKEQWCRLNRMFMAYEYQDENVWENPMDKGDPGIIFDRVIQDEHSPNRLFFIEEGGEVIGFINTVVFISIWAHGSVLFIDDFFISEEHRGKGFGQKALEELESEMRAEGFKRIQLMAEDTNPGAVRFYEREGYRRQRINFFCKYL